MKAHFFYEFQKLKKHLKQMSGKVWCKFGGLGELNQKSRNAEYNSASALHLAGKQRAQEYDLQLFLAYQLNPFLG